MPRRILDRSPHVEDVERARGGLGAEPREHRLIDALDAKPPRDMVRRGPRPGEPTVGYVWSPIVLVAVAGQAGEVPAHGAVAQGHHRVGHARVDKRLRAD